MFEAFRRQFSTDLAIDLGTANTLIYVRHKGIVLGNKGETIKAIGQAARIDLVAFLERPVHLFLQVKVRPNWLDEPDRYSEMGLDFKDGD